MRVLVLVLLLVPFWFLPSGEARAEDRSLTRDEYADQISKRLNAARKVWLDGKRDTAMKIVKALDEEMNGYETFMDGHPAFWWPDLEIVRYAAILKDGDMVADYAAPIIAALDTDAARGSPERIEAMLFLAKSLNLEKKYSEAEVLLRGLLRDKGPQVRDKLVLEAETYLSAVATTTGAPDAEALRAALLHGYLDRDGAKASNYLILWRRDLEARRLGHADRKKLGADARLVFEFLQSDPRAEGIDDSKLVGELTRVFIDVRDFVRAEPLMKERLERLSRDDPQSLDYFWAVENLMGLHNRQKKYATNLGIGAGALDQLDGRADNFARVTGAIANQLGYALKNSGNQAGAQEMYRRAYTEVRRVVSANDPKAQTYRSRLDLSMIDPDAYPFAEELGLKRLASVAPAAHGSEVLRRFWAGDYVAVGNWLRQLEKDPIQDQTVVRLNSALYNAFLGETGPALDDVAAARKSVAETGGGAVAADSAWFDIYEVMAYVLARDREPATAGRILDRLEARDPSSMTDDQIRLLPLMRTFQATLAEDNAGARDSFRASFVGHDPLADTSPWGLARSLFILGFAGDHLPPAEMDALYQRTAAAVAEAGSPLLLSAMVEVTYLNVQAGALASERRFQELAFHLRTLSRTLPPEHQWQIVARVNYAYGLRERGRREEALALMRDSTEDYRSSVWHVPDVLAQLFLEQAIIIYEMGRVQTAEALATEVYRSMNVDTFRARYWMPILTTYAASLARSGKAEAGLAAMQDVLTSERRLARLTPADLALLLQVAAGIHGLLGQTDAQIALLRRAEATLPSSGYRRDIPLAGVLLDVANARFGRQEYVAAWDAITRSNQLWFDAQAAVAAEGGSDLARNRDHDHARIVNEAVLGWVMAREAQK